MGQMALKEDGLSTFSQAREQFHIHVLKKQSFRPAWNLSQAYSQSLGKEVVDYSTKERPSNGGRRRSRVESQEAFENAVHPAVISADKCIGCSGCGSGRLGRLALNTNLLSFLLFQCFPLASVPARTGSMLNGSMVFSLLGFILDSEWELRVSTLLYDFSYLSGRREEPGRRASNRESHASVIYYERVQIRGKRQEQLILRQSTPGVKSTMFQTKKQKANLIFLLHEKILKMWRPNGELTSLTWATTILKLTDGEDYKRALTGDDSKPLSHSSKHPEFRPSLATVTQTALWIRLPELPIELSTSTVKFFSK
ncbi:hypothetical protein Q3G72_009325 [Acer saccharum]|nr:hypothetical protein Q3G72_008730 [Acer saccharum]KAK1567204.1 hypothetical protein Q3G72_009325 [Acer saccharum]